MRRSAKWTATFGTGVGVFALGWWLCDVPLAMDTGNALGIAALPSGLATTLLGWWAGRDEASSPRQVTVVGPVPRKPQHFQPPTHVLAALTTKAKTPAVVCSVTGQRGVGKTQAAGAYARKRIADGWWVAWIPAQTAELVMTGLAELADALGLRQPDDTTSTLIARVRNFLHTFREPMLLVFDNVTDPDHVLPHLPAAGSTQIVLTSAAQLDNVGHPVPVEVFTEQIAVRFLASATRLADESGARELAQELGCLPLALAQAAARVVRVDRDYATYLQRHRTLRLDELLKARPGDPYPHGTAEAILLALEPFLPDDDTPTLLDLLSVLSPDGVSKDLLVAMTPDPTEMPEDLAVLCEASLVELAGTDRSVVVMHRLTRRVLRDRAGHGLRRVLDVSAALLMTQTFPEDQAWQRRALGDELVRHINSLWVHAAPMVNPASPPDWLLQAQRWAVVQLTASAAFDQAFITGAAALEDHQSLYGHDHPHTVTVIGNLANAYLLAARTDQAIPLYEQHLASSRQILGPHDLDTLRAASNLAHAYLAAGMVDKAIKLNEETLAARQRELGHHHRDTLVSAGNLAIAYEAAGRIKEATQLLEQNLADRQRELGQHHPHTIKAGEALAGAYFNAGRRDEGIALHEQALADRRRELGQHHPDTLLSAVTLAAAYGSVGRRQDAVTLMEQTASAAARELGRDHPITQKSLTGLKQLRE